MRYKKLLKIIMSSKMNCLKSNRWRIAALTTISLCIIFFIVMSTQLIENSDQDVFDVVEYEKQYFDAYGDFLIDGENCKIPNLHPFSSTVMTFYKRLKYQRCHELDSLTYIMQDENLNNHLMINLKEKEKYLSWYQNEITCCYERITRSGSKDQADNQFKLSKCIDFSSGHVLRWREDEFIIAKCKGFLDYFGLRQIKTQIYSDAHALVIPKLKVLNKFKEAKTKNAPSVLLIGIDSISRLNFIRSMPETFKFVSTNGWYDMKAFNKIGDNTYPNLNALLNGRNLSILERDCNWKKVGELEKCRFLWNEFNDANYATAYAEDAVNIQTFNYYKTGFVHPPTDHYLRPFTLAAEKHVEPKFPSTWEIKCLGHRHYADVIYQYARDFANAYKNNSFFGLFWTNSFSHDVLNLPSEYDSRMRFYLEELKSLQILNNTIVIFFSDHGIRFGDIRKYYTGWLEERLPFLYLWLPESFKLEYPDLAENLRINQERLVSPYDLHITVKHILKLAGGYKEDLTAISCPTCQSLFLEVPNNRTCPEAGIDKHWCTCTDFKEIDTSSLNVEKVVRFALNRLNSELSAHKNCAQLKLSKVSSARESVHGTFSIDFLISFEVLPSKGEMEATIRCSDLDCDNEMQVIGEISRINKYGEQSRCVTDAHLRKYCYCV